MCLCQYDTHFFNILTCTKHMVFTYFLQMLVFIWTLSSVIRPSHQRCSCEKKVFLKISQNSKKNTCASLLFNKVANLRTATLLKRRLWQKCFPVNFAKFFSIPFLQNTSVRLLLRYAKFALEYWKALISNEKE